MSPTEPRGTRADRTWRWVLRKIVLPAGDAAFHHGMMRRLNFLEQAQWWDPDRLHERRDQALRALIAVCYAEVPFYRNLMDRARVSPRDIRTPADLAKLPIVSKSMLRAAGRYEKTRDTGLNTYEANTSGSTGQNFSVTEDAETAGWYRASFLLSLEWAGWQIGEPHVMTGMTSTRTLARRLKDRFLRCRYISAFDLRDEHLDRTLEDMDRRGIAHVWGYAASLYYLARRAQSRGWNRPLRSIVTWGDNLYPQYRRTIEAAFGRRVFDTYGVGEGTQVSAQCGADGGYHVHTLDTVVEYVDANDQPVPPHEKGSLLLTRLHPGPMPLIRYRVGDIGIAGDQTPCPCGRGLDRMAAISGRETDVVITPSGNRLIAEFFAGLIDDFHEVEHFQILQEDIRSITVTVVPRHGMNTRIAKEIASVIRANCAADLEVRVETTPSIPLEATGKRRYVISKVSAGA